PLLYRYFPSKEALIERVYQEVFVGRWDPFWEELIQDRSLPLEERLTGFYQSYARVIVTREWVRLFMFAGLKGLDFNARYLRLLRERIFVKIIAEIRLEYRQHTIEALPPTDLEIEMIWALHASIFYLGVRQFIYDIPLQSKLDDIIKAQITTLLRGIKSLSPA
ncbi:MAG: TetR/AcrR family transcriptional regulator, partial [Geminicoccaceae bacterium]